MGLFGLLVFFAVATAISLLWRGFRDRVHNKHTSLSESTQGLRLTTHRATFVFDRTANKIWIERRGLSPAHIDASNVRGVQVRVGYTEAALEELFIEGMSWGDMYREYRDHRVTWSVTLNTSHGPVALAVLSQYKKRDWFDLWTPVLHKVLTLLGHYELGEAVAARIEEQVRVGLRSMGLQVLGGYGSVAHTGALEGVPLPAEADLQMHRATHPRTAPPAPPTSIELPTVTSPGPAPWPSTGRPVQPDPVQPDPVQPDSVQPDSVQPDSVQPDPVPHRVSSDRD